MTIPPVERTVNRTRVRLERGDLTALEVDAFVFYAREDLVLGSGFGTAIQVRGGDSIKKELERLGRLAPGQAVVSGAGRLKAKFIIHACGPKFQEPDTERKLRATMQAALRAAEEKGVKTLAFPPMGAGFYGVPWELCARVMLEEIQSWLKGQTRLEEVIICVVDGREFQTFQPDLEKL
jgi:O-acetyl-ADP-ribose deacetylase (regulator of RNase III)